MKKKKQQVKIPKSARHFIGENNKTESKSKFGQLFIRGKLKKGLPADTYIKAANLLARGFAGKEYHGKRKRRRKRQAKEILQTFHDFSTLHGDVKFFHPPKKQRKQYARQIGVTSKFKVYPLPILTEKDIYKVEKGKLKRISKNVSTELYFFPDVKKAAKNPYKETLKLLQQIQSYYGETIRDMKIICGEYRSHVNSNKDETIEEQEDYIQRIIGDWFNRYTKFEYGRGDKAEKWLFGIEVNIFPNAEPYPEELIKARGGKAAIKKRKSKEAQKHDNRKGR